MSSTEFSVNRDDTTDVNYLALTDANGDSKSENLRKNKMSFWTLQKLGICVLVQTVLLIAYVFISIPGLYGYRSQSPSNNKFQSLASTQLPPKGDATKPAGGTYVRWGRTQCSDTADFVYSGFTAGAKGGVSVLDIGGGSNYLCLPSQPRFNQSISGQQITRSRIYAVEYRGYGEGVLNSYHNQDAPCVMCQSRGGRTQSFMMPATTHCPTGWTREYYGYLAAARFDHHRSEYVCLDDKPEVIPGTEALERVSFFYHVEVVRSEGLPDEYVTGNDMTCAVCTM